MRIALVMTTAMVTATAPSAPYHIGVNTGWVPNVGEAARLQWAFDCGADMPRVGARMDLAQGDGIAHPDAGVTKFAAAGRHPLLFLFNGEVETRRPDGSLDWGCEVPRGLWGPVFTDGSDVAKPGATVDPHNPWATFVWRIVERYDGDGVDDAPGSPRVEYYSLWNEPDWLPWPERPKDPARKTMRGWFGADMSDLARLLFISRQAARFADPKAKIGLQICFPETLGFLLDDPKYPAAKSLDFVDYHAYAGPGSDLMVEGGDGLLPVLRQMRGEFEKRGLRAPEMVCTECGHPGDNSLGPARSEAVQRAAVVKEQIVGAGQGLIGVCWYGLFDPSWQSMGLVGDVSKLPTDGKGARLKDAFFALRTLAELLPGLARGTTAYEQALDLGPDARGHVLKSDDGKRVWVLWAYDGKGEPTKRVNVKLAIPVRLARCEWDFCLAGKPAELLPPQGGEREIEAGIDPTYLIEYTDKPPSMTPVARPNG